MKHRMKRGRLATTLAVLASAFTCTMVAAGCGGGDEQASGGGDAAPDPVQLFASTGCAACHTFEPAEATGSVGPNLDETTRSKAEMEDRIRNGVGIMPPYENQLSTAEIDSLVELIADPR